MDLFQEIASLAAQGTPFVIATVVANGGSSPQKPGARLVLLRDGSTRGTVGGGGIERQVIEAARALLVDPERSTQLLEANLGQDLGMSCGGTMTVFLERIAASERLIVFGAGHVGRALSQIARTVGFRVTVVDAREELLTEERFPEAERVLGDPREAARGLPGDERTFVCVMTHDHALDQELVEVLLPKPFRFVGLIGSLRKGERCRAQLAAKGLSPETVARLRSPMGIELAAQSPEEIALSIAAELVALRNGLERSQLRIAKSRSA